jgi:cell division protein FtsI (penicillin-binding protein 3)
MGSNYAFANTITLYNAVANNGEMVKPQFVTEIKEWNKSIKKNTHLLIQNLFRRNHQKIKALLENVKHGTGSKLYSKNFQWQEKPELHQANYVEQTNDKHYISSFVGFFRLNIHNILAL